MDLEDSTLTDPRQYDAGIVDSVAEAKIPANKLRETVYLLVMQLLQKNISWNKHNSG